MSSQPTLSPTTILFLPPEIFASLECYLEIRELAAFSLTHSTIYHRIGRFQYKKVYIANSVSDQATSNKDTKYFVSLLHRRPEIIPWIYKFVIAEYDEEYLPQLLGHTFPKLENIIIQHDGPLRSHGLPHSSLDNLNSRIASQPSLGNLTLNIEQLPTANLANCPLYPIPSSATTLFLHPGILRMRLSYLDLTSLSSSPSTFTHTLVRELFLERCKYDGPTLTSLLAPCVQLAHLCLYQDQRLPFPECELPSLLTPVRRQLRVLKVLWSHLYPLSNTGMDLTSFPVLHSLIIHPEMLFGRAYISLTGDDLSSLIISKLPPNLMILDLEGVVRLYTNELHETLSAPMVFQSRDATDNPNPLSDEDFALLVARTPPDPAYIYRPPSTTGKDVPVPLYDQNLMKHILNHKSLLAPRLKWLVCKYLEHSKILSKEMMNLAKAKGVRSCELYEYDEIAPPLVVDEETGWWEGMDKVDREGELGGGVSGYLMLNHKYGTQPWPGKAAGNY